MLAVGGQLDLSPGESPVAGLGTLVTENDASDSGYKAKEANGRTVYLPIIRNELPALLTAFDFADPEFVVGQRPVTNVPSQALLLLNSPQVKQAAEGTAKRLLSEASLGDERRADWAYRTLLGRMPSDAERDRAIEFVRKTIGDEKLNEQQKREQEAWARLIHAMFATTEFRMLD
jgi:hypothetical protein